MKTMSIDIGGVGDQVEIPLTIKGCACRSEDFTMALVGFVRQWKKQADTQKPNPGEKKPCGCKDK